MAKLAVSWALSRFKSEKSWERRIAAYSHVLNALNEIQHVLGEWEDIEVTRREVSDLETKELRDALDRALKNLRGMRGEAQLLLHPSVDESIKRLPDFEAVDWFTSIEDRWVVVQRAKEQILKQAQEDGVAAAS